jgi:Holliday junction DNA helicase RuvB
MRYIGNEDIRNQIRVSFLSAMQRNDAMPHMLFAGAAGCGKTTLAREVAKDSGYKFLPVLPESLDNYQHIIDVMEALDHTNYDEHGNRRGKIVPTLIFVDEIHRLNVKAQEILGIAMENFHIESEIRGRVYWLPKFTLIGATTDDGSLSKPFRDRFKFRFPFKTYTLDEICEIINVHANRLNIVLTPKSVRKIANRGRGVPRIVVGYLERCRDMAIALKSDIVTSDIVEQTFQQLHVDPDGLTEVEVEILRALYEERGPVGLESLSIRVNENTKTLRNSAEPYLIQKGLIIINGRGRKITEKGVKHLEKNGYVGRQKITKVDIPIDYERK